MEHSVTGSPELIPYPDWRSNMAGDCVNSITTAYRIKVDKCGRLWVLDTGTVGIGNTTVNLCPYAVNIFDLQTNTRIRRYELRREDTNANTFIANIAVDIGENCDDAFAYFADELGYGIVVYSWQLNRSWRFSSHSYFLPDPLRGDFDIAGLNFQWGEEGIFGMSLSPLKADGFRLLYFSPLASHRQFAVSTKILRNENRTEDSYHDFMVLDERGPRSHTTARVMSDDGVELFNLIDQNAVGCWNSATTYGPENHAIVDRDDAGLVFPADVKIDENDNVWVLSDRMPVFLLSNLDFKDVNFRIFMAPLHSLLEGTICEQKADLYSPAHNSLGVYNPPANNVYNKQYLRPVSEKMPANSYTPHTAPPFSFAFGTLNSWNKVRNSGVTGPDAVNTLGSGSTEAPREFTLPQPNSFKYQPNGPHRFPHISTLTPGGPTHNYVPARNLPWWQQDISQYN